MLKKISCSFLSSVFPPPALNRAVHIFTNGVEFIDLHIQDRNCFQIRKDSVERKKEKKRKKSQFYGPLLLVIPPIPVTVWELRGT